MAAMGQPTGQWHEPTTGKAYAAIVNAMLGPEASLKQVRPQMQKTVSLSKVARQGPTRQLPHRRESPCR